MRLCMSHASRLAVCLCLVALGATSWAAERSESRADVEAKLAEARKRLDEAAREVAELSMSLAEVPGALPPLVFPAPRAALGILLGPDRDKHKDGVEILSVSPGGAAEEAGLKSGDVIIEIDGRSLAREGERDPHEKLLSYIREVEPNQKVRLKYRRDGKTHEVELAARPMRSPVVIQRSLGDGVPPTFGIEPDVAFFRARGVFGSAELVAVTPKLGRYFGTDKGLLVVRAPDDSRLKLEEGDVILDIDGRVPSSPSHAFRILSSYQGGEKLKLNVMRDKKRLSFEVVIPEDAPKGSRFETRQFLNSVPLPPPARTPGRRIDGPRTTV
jgi:hypothetical protein